MDRTEAVIRVGLLVDADVDPSFSSLDLERLVDDAARPDAAGNSPLNVASAATWQASTWYSYGDVVTADPAADRWWRCVTPGTSGTSQPDWPDRAGLPPGAGSIVDGDVTWVDAGTVWTPTYDLNAAAAAGWRIKAGRLAGRYDFQTDGQTFRRAQLLAHCRLMERMFRRRIAVGP